MHFFRQAYASLFDYLIVFHLVQQTFMTHHTLQTTLQLF